jgi:SAM-dependent methyltransferase
MAPTTEGNHAAAAAAGFYDALASSYDAMTDFQNRIVREEPVLRAFVDRHGVRTAIDAGSGTGALAILLARLGVAVTAVDVSAAMLRGVETNALRFGLQVGTLREDLSGLSPANLPRSDALLCMGNTLAHLPGPAALADAFRAFHSVIRPGGVLVCQVLNYSRILTARERVQNIRESDGVTFVRFYDFEPDRLIFNILRIERGESGLRHTLTSVPLHPFRSGDLLSALSEAGFREHRLCEDLAGTPFNESASRDLVILAERPG